jgi:XTP/dITP diphosphohydrolase
MVIVCYIPAVTLLLIATNNQGKVHEYEELLVPLALRLCTPGDLELSINVREDGSSYEDNACIKALAYQRASGLFALADDSGLEVDALDGRPGLHSARYGEPDADDEGRYQLLLEQLQGVPWEQRTARFRCVVVVATPMGHTHSTEGVCEGIIAFEPQGSGGFGYDPVFYMPEHGKTMGQLSPSVKNRISHRAHAVRNMLPVLARILQGKPGKGE